jgi:hypothetical protein
MGTRPDKYRWRPRQYVRPLAIGVIRRGDAVLLEAVHDDDGSTKGWRPPGGQIEFGESAADALRREIDEELGESVTDPVLLGIFENLYQHHGVQGHEVVFVFETGFAEPAVYERDDFRYTEKGITYHPQWVRIAELQEGDRPLYPAGLLALFDDDGRTRDPRTRETAMSWLNAPEPQCPAVDDADAIETLIVPRARDIGDFEVRRVLPSAKRRMVGPFIFFDQMGPADFAPGRGIDVRPHPHIGLATVTYLYSGELQHRDSLGSNQMIYPGALNWMIAGRGITHSERTSAATRDTPHDLYGIQTWVALPDDAEDTAPAFEHHPKEALPTLGSEGTQARLILGNAYGETAPVKTFSAMFYVDAQLDAGAAMPLPDEHEDRGAYVVSGAIEVAGQRHAAGAMLVFRGGVPLSLKAGEAGARVMLLGGERFASPRHIWWNFVASSRERIEAAKAAWRETDWQHGRFRLPPDDDGEFIPLPQD